MYDPRGRPLKPGLAWLTRKWLGRTIQDRGPSRHDPEQDTRVCVDSLKSKDQNWTRVSEFKTDYEPIMARIARSQSHSPSRDVGTGARTAIVDHGKPGAWHGTSAATPTTTVACTNDAEVLEGVLGAMDTHEFGFARLLALADALGPYVGFVLSFLSSLLPPIFDLELTRFGWFPLLFVPFSGIKPKATADGGTSPENPETSRNNAVPTENANRDTAAETPEVPPAAASPDQNQTGNVLFSAVSNLNAQPCN